MRQEPIEALHDRIEAIIRHMQKIQREIRASRQPAAQYEIDALKKLGMEYAEIITRLEQQSAMDKPVDPLPGSGPQGRQSG